MREQHGLPPLGACNELQAVTGAGPMPPTPPPEFRIDRMITTTLGHLGLFNQRLQQQSKSIEWSFDDTVTESNRATPVWSAKALIDGVCWGYGRGNTKKAAKNEAAKQGLRRMGFDEASTPPAPICVPCAPDCCLPFTDTQGYTGLLASLFRRAQECASVRVCAPSCPCVEIQAL